MDQISTIGLDLAKNVFQVHGIDASGNVVLRKKLRRSQVIPFFASLPPCLVGLEACATAHHWAREIRALGHDVRLMPPAYVKSYVKRNKNDPADAEACCEAVLRPSMRIVPVKTAEQQSALVAHRARELLVNQRTMLVNALRGHLAEFGVVAAKGLPKLAELVAVVADDADARVPAFARRALQTVARQIDELDARIDELEDQIIAWHKASPMSRRLGPITATAIAATVPDPKVFCSGRGFAAWIGLVPRQNSSGDKKRLGRISKAGDGRLRRLLVNGAMSVMFGRKAAKTNAWLLALRQRKPVMEVAVALANKMARTAWAVMRRETGWSPTPPAARRAAA
jgi:transposase